MELQLLPLETAAQVGFTHRITLTHEDLTQATANTAQTIPILSVPAGAYVRDCATYLETAFADASDTAFNTTAIIIGDDGDTDRLLASTELNVNGTEVIWQGTVAANVPYIFTAANTIDLIVGSMAAKSLSDIDTGKLVVYLNVAHLAGV